MAIEYDVITDVDKLEIADMRSKISSIDALRDKIKADNDTAKELWKIQDAELQTEKAKLTKTIRNKRQARIV